MTVTVYVSKDLKEAMRATKLPWSKIATAAFRAAIKAKERQAHWFPTSPIAIHQEGKQA